MTTWTAGRYTSRVCERSGGKDTCINVLSLFRPPIAIREYCHRRSRRVVGWMTLRAALIYFLTGGQGVPHAARGPQNARPTSLISMPIRNSLLSRKAVEAAEASLQPCYSTYWEACSMDHVKDLARAAVKIMLERCRGFPDRAKLRSGQSNPKDSLGG